MREDYGETICMREVNENIRRVFNDQPLTRPLRVLKNNCDFKKRFDIAFDLKYNVKRCRNCQEEFKAKEKELCCSIKCKIEHKKNYPGRILLTEEEKRNRLKEYYRRPEVKAKTRKYNKKYYGRPEVKERQEKYRKKYNQRPGVKERSKEYYKNNKEKIMKQSMERYQKNREKRLEYSRKYYQNKKNEDKK